MMFSYFDPRTNATQMYHHLYSNAPSFVFKFTIILIQIHHHSHSSSPSFAFKFTVFAFKCTIFEFRRTLGQIQTLNHIQNHTDSNFTVPLRGGRSQGCERFKRAVVCGPANLCRVVSGYGFSRSLLPPIRDGVSFAQFWRNFHSDLRGS